jgi:hypothetical protein
MNRILTVLPFSIWLTLSMFWNSFGFDLLLLEHLYLSDSYKEAIEIFCLFEKNKHAHHHPPKITYLIILYYITHTTHSSINTHILHIDWSHTTNI